MPYTVPSPLESYHKNKQQNRRYNSGRNDKFKFLGPTEWRSNDIFRSYNPPPPPKEKPQKASTLI